MGDLMLKKIPLPFAGVALAFLTLGNILQERSNGIRVLCGVIASVILLLILVKLITNTKQVQKALKNPMIATSFATFPMALMLLAVYLLPVMGVVAKALWLVSLLIHFLLLAYICVYFLRSFSWQKFFTSYFVPFVGFVVASVTAPAFQMITLGKVLFYLGFVFYLLLLLPVLYRIFIIKQLPAAAQPTNMIVAAPASLCLAGYLSSFEKPVFSLVVILLALSIVNTFLGYYFFVKTDQKNFYPSFAAATFPFVISALALKKATAYFAIQNAAFHGFLAPLTQIEIVIAIAACCYVLIRYAVFLLAKSPKVEKNVANSND